MALENLIIERIGLKDIGADIFQFLFAKFNAGAGRTDLFLAPANSMHIGFALTFPFLRVYCASHMPYRIFLVKQ